MVPWLSNRSVYVIAEAGVNHNGSIRIARQLVDAAAEAGADAVKFQTFIASKLVTKGAVAAEYQTASTGESSQFQMLKELELSASDHEALMEYSAARNIQFLSTGFDGESVSMLSELGVPMFKIPSGEITNFPLLQIIASFQKPTVVSTGMASLAEIRQCVRVLCENGLTREKISVLHCNTQYPTPMADVNLRAMLTIRDAIPEITVGYSDHTLGIEIPIAAVALGAKLIEKHFTLDRAMPGPDHAASLEPDELKKMVSAIRNTEAAMGDGVKRVSPSELPNVIVARKSIVAAIPIQAGDIFTESNLTTKRPATGRSPMDWLQVIGSRAGRAYQVDEQID
ncbi:N,N'-diacetyllegionaminic acid synthase [Stieleria neptunia]|uniref:N,N'-diacetyllegionaminic acid synthase n=1 Tax=Stieleria neptunia TaxID=2527979 RepID=A0A518HTM3_9BACT|nr:N-acetylneuraminate synthase [Stieleria neptunia]QDV44208.1 N,N'-diacetyllegionaminic acid synthase [Stieleria neptunia]